MARTSSFSPIATLSPHPFFKAPTLLFFLISCSLSSCLLATAADDGSSYHTTSTPAGSPTVSQDGRCTYEVIIKTSRSSPKANEVNCNAVVEIFFGESPADWVEMKNTLNGKCAPGDVRILTATRSCLRRKICYLQLDHKSDDKWTPLYVMVSESGSGSSNPPVLFCINEPVPPKYPFYYSACGEDLAALPTACDAANRTTVEQGRNTAR